MLAALLAGVLVLFGFGPALGARGRAQRAADLSAVSAAQVMRRDFSRLFEPPFLEAGLANPRQRPGLQVSRRHDDRRRRCPKRPTWEPVE